MNTLAIVPARFGSKGLPRKNIKLLNGKPLIAYTLEAAQKARNVDLFISTDDLDVLTIGKTYGINWDYVRPSDLATDHTSMADVVSHCLGWLEERGHCYDSFVLLQPTSPLRTAEDIERSIEMLHASKTSSVVGVSPMWTHPSECIELHADSSWQFLVPPREGVSRRQDFSGSYQFINGAIYAVKTYDFKREKKFVFKNSLMLTMDEINTIDIDTERDFILAQALITKAVK